MSAGQILIFLFFKFTTTYIQVFSGLKLIYLLVLQVSILSQYSLLIPQCWRIYSTASVLKVRGSVGDEKLVWCEEHLISTFVLHYFFPRHEEQVWQVKKITVFRIPKQREIILIALDRQGTQQQRPEWPTVPLLGMQVKTRYINSTTGTSSILSV